jgi:hypothetical protein
MREVQEHQGVSQSNSFLTGFSFGLFVGAAGYYLYGTERGKKLREHMVSEFEAAKVQLVKEGIITRPEVSFREFVGDVLEKIFGGRFGMPEDGTDTVVEQRLIAHDRAAARPTERRTAKSFYKPRKTTTQRFKGV